MFALYSPNLVYPFLTAYLDLMSISIGASQSI